MNVRDTISGNDLKILFNQRKTFGMIFTFMIFTDNMSCKQLDCNLFPFTEERILDWTNGFQFMTRKPVLIDDYVLEKDDVRADFSRILNSYSHVLERRTHFLLVCDQNTLQQILIEVFAKE